MLAFVGNQPINVIGPIPQTYRLAFGNTGSAAWVGALCDFPVDRARDRFGQSHLHRAHATADGGIVGPRGCPSGFRGSIHGGAHP
ncbi:MAG: hypothetical protein WDO73_00195 [Ignavibacteriota bacterium]